MKKFFIALTLICSFSNAEIFEEGLACVQYIRESKTPVDWGHIPYNIVDGNTLSRVIDVPNGDYRNFRKSNYLIINYGKNNNSIFSLSKNRKLSTEPRIYVDLNKRKFKIKKTPKQGCNFN